MPPPRKNACLGAVPVLVIGNLDVIVTTFGPPPVAVAHLRCHALHGYTSHDSRHSCRAAIAGGNRWPLG